MMLVALTRFMMRVAVNRPNARGTDSFHDACGQAALYPRNSQLCVGAAMANERLGHLKKARMFYKCGVQCDKHHHQAWQVRQHHHIIIITNGCR
jgi:TPR repeat protein